MSLNQTKTTYRDIWTDDAKASVWSNQTINSTEDINITAHAEDRLRTRWAGWRDKRSVAIATGAENTTITQSGINTTISAYAQAQETYAYGLEKSTLDLKGNNNKNVEISAKTRITGTYDPAWGIKDSRIVSSEGNDKLVISADAGVHETGQYRQSQSIKSFGSENSTISTGGGNDEVLISANSSYSRQMNRWGDRLNGREDARGTDWGAIEDVDNASNGEAVALLNSSIDLGTGNDSLSLNAKGFSTEARRGRDWGGGRWFDVVKTKFESSIAAKNSNIKKSKSIKKSKPKYFPVNPSITK